MCYWEIGCLDGRPADRRGCSYAFLQLYLVILITSERNYKLMYVSIFIMFRIYSVPIARMKLDSPFVALLHPRSAADGWHDLGVHHWLDQYLQACHEGYCFESEWSKRSFLTLSEQNIRFYRYGCSDKPILSSGILGSKRRESKP